MPQPLRLVRQADDVSDTMSAVGSTLPVKIVDLRCFFEQRGWVHPNGFRQMHELVDVQSALIAFNLRNEGLRVIKFVGQLSLGKSSLNSSFAKPIDDPPVAGVGEGIRQTASSCSGARKRLIPNQDYPILG